MSASLLLTTYRFMPSNLPTFDVPPVAAVPRAPLGPWPAVEDRYFGYKVHAQHEALLRADQDSDLRCGELSAEAEALLVPADDADLPRWADRRLPNCSSVAAGPVPHPAADSNAAAPDAQACVEQCAALSPVAATATDAAVEAATTDQLSAVDRIRARLAVLRANNDRSISSVSSSISSDSVSSVSSSISGMRNNALFSPQASFELLGDGSLPEEASQCLNPLFDCSGEAASPEGTDVGLVRCPSITPFTSPFAAAAGRSEPRPAGAHQSQHVPSWPPTTLKDTPVATALEGPQEEAATPAGKASCWPSVTCLLAAAGDWIILI